MNHAQDGPAVVNFTFYQRFDFADTPPALARRGWRRVCQAARYRVPEQPAHLVGRGVSRGQRAGRKRAADPVCLLGPFGDLTAWDRLVLEAEQLLARLVSAAELGEHATAQLGAHATLAEPDPEVYLLGPEVLRPDLPVHLVQVRDPAWPTVRCRVQAGRPLSRWVAAVRDPQVHLGVGHPD